MEGGGLVKLSSARVALRQRWPLTRSSVAKTMGCCIWTKSFCIALDISSRRIRFFFCATLAETSCDIEETPAAAAAPLLPPSTELANSSAAMRARSCSIAEAPLLYSSVTALKSSCGVEQSKMSADGGARGCFSPATACVLCSEEEVRVGMKLEQLCVMKEGEGGWSVVWCPASVQRVRGFRCTAL